MPQAPQECPKCGQAMEKRATVNFGEERATPKRAGGLREFFTWRQATRTWLCPNCGCEIPRKLGFFDTY